jgi:hypothetical protein
MDGSFERRRKLMVQLLGVALVGVGAGVYGCGSTVETPKGEGGGGMGGAGVGGIPFDDGPIMTTACFQWPFGGSGGMAGSGGTGGMASGGAGGMGGGGGGGGMAGAGGSTTITCPPKAEASMYFEPWCGETTAQSEGTFADGACCYDVLMPSCGVGRPFVVAGRAQTAIPTEQPSGWADLGKFEPDVSALSADERAFLAEAWTRDGLLEHASIASFGRFALELLAVGAPATLVELAHKAALDEVRHAQIAFELATAYAGTTIGPSAFPFAGGAVEVSSDLANVAARVVQEGCIGETLASMVAAEQAARATDPAVRKALEIIAEDEARHAELAWRTIAWALGHANPSVRRAITNAFAKGLTTTSFFDVAAGSDGPLEAHGRPAVHVLRAAMTRTVAEVIRPVVEALLGTHIEDPSSRLGCENALDTV